MGKRKKSWQEKVGIALSLLGILAMVFFTLIPLFGGGSVGY